MPPGSLETVKDGKEVCNIMITPTSLVAMQQWDFRLFHWLFPTHIFSEGLKVMKSGCQVEHGPMTCWTPAVLLTVPRFQINRGLNIPTQGCCLEGCSWKIDAQTCSSARPAAEFFVTRKKNNWNWFESQAPSVGASFPPRPDPVNRVVPRHAKTPWRRWCDRRYMNIPLHKIIEVP